MKHFLLLLLTAITLNAEQSFFNTSATINNPIFYGVEQNVEIKEHDSPTDFYLSIGSGQTWTKISQNFRWGDDLSNSRTITWTPTNTVSSPSYLGIHTGTRNSGTFSNLPTDVSDNSFTISLSSITFERLDDIWYDDIFNLKWKRNLDELPPKLILQYRNNNTWTTLDTVNSTQEQVAIHNTFSKSNTDFRLTYMGNLYGYTLGMISSTFIDRIFEIQNKSEIENTIYGDNELITINYIKQRYSQYTYIRVEGDNYIDSIGYFDNTSTFLTPNGFTGLITLQYYNEEGDVIETLNINSMNKYFELSPVTDDVFDTNSLIEFNWSYSNNFDLVSVKLNDDYINEEWELKNDYNYSVKESNTFLNFEFTVDDGVTKITRRVNNLTIQDDCEELEIAIDSLENVISELSVSAYDTVFIVTIKDIVNNVETDYSIKKSNVTEIILLNNDRLRLNDFINELHIYNIQGTLIDKFTNVREISTLSYESGVYFIVAIDKNIVNFYKFLKN